MVKIEILFKLSSHLKLFFFKYKIRYLVILISFCDNYIFEVGQCQNGKSKELLIVVIGNKGVLISWLMIVVIGNKGVLISWFKGVVIGN